MDRDDALFIAEPDAGYATRAETAVSNSGVSTRDAILIVMSWAALASFVVYPGLQLIAFGAALFGVAVLNRPGKGA